MSIVNCITHIVLIYSIKGSENEVLSQEKSPLAFTGILPEEKTERTTGQGLATCMIFIGEMNVTVGAELDPSAACKCH